MNLGLPRRFSPVLVGREAHMQALVRLLDEAAAGRGGAALLKGEAGAGKSRLVAELAGVAAQRGHVVLLGQAFENEEANSCATLVDMLRTYAVTTAALPSERTETWQAEDLGQLLRTLRHAQSGTDIGQVPAARDRAADAFLSFVQGLCETGPVLLIFEDLHWADEATLRCLHLLFRRVGGLPALVVGSYRTTDVKEPLGRLLEQVLRGRYAVELDVPPLGEREVDELLRHAYGLDEPVPRAFLTALRDLTGGNPFFVEEVMWSLHPGGARPEARSWDHLSAANLRVPSSIKEAVARRLALVSEEAASLAGIAAVLGHRFDLDLLQNATAHAERRLLALVKELVSVGLVVEESSQVFAFRHALTARAVYDGLLDRERRVRHRQVADELRRRLHASGEEGSGLLAQLANHSLLGEQWEEAKELGALAGEAALEAEAPGAAAELLTVAISACERLGLPRDPRLLHLRARAYAALGAFHPAHADYQELLAMSDEDPAFQWRLRMELGRLWTARDFAVAKEHFEEALVLARQVGDRVALARTLNRLGNWHANVDEPAAALNLHEQARDLLAEDRSDPEARREAATTADLIAVAHSIAGDQTRALMAYRTALAAFERLGDRRGAAGVRINLAELVGQWHLYHMSGPTAADPQAAMVEGEAALEETVALNWRSGQAWALLTLAGGHTHRGEFGRALERGRRALDLAEELGNRQWEALSHLALANAHLDMLNGDLAAQHAGQALDLAHETGSVVYARFAAHYLARASVLIGDVAAANGVLAPSLAETLPMKTVGQRLLWSAHAEVLLASGDFAGAQRVLDRLIRGIGEPTEPVLPYLWRLRGAALAAQGGLDEAHAHLQSARTAAMALRWRPEELRATLDLGRLLRRMRRWKHAGEEFARARDLARSLVPTSEPELGARFLSRVEELAPVGVRGSRDGLTPREREIVHLVTAGHSNKWIARRLGLSERTVEKHVSNVLGKLGVRSRAQLAARALALHHEQSAVETRT